VTRAWLHLTTRFSDDGVHQLTMRGPVFIPWKDVKRLEAHGTPIVIIGNEARIDDSQPTLCRTLRAEPSNR
jgi:hypothetical protein